jgi:hypothetical protein
LQAGSVNIKLVGQAPAEIPFEGMKESDIGAPWS